MKVSLNTLQDYFDGKLPAPVEVANKLTFHAFEIESVEEVGGHLNGVVVGKVLKKEKHPNADRLSVCIVDVGDGGRTIVCGAPNVAEGQTVAVALPGTKLSADMEIKVSKIRGIESNGMICSERELGFTKEAEGIWVLPPRQTGTEKEVLVGTPLKDFLGVETDYIFDIKVLPDRAHDCLSHQGIAREVSAIFSLPLKPVLPIKNFPQGSSLKISIEKGDISKRYIGAIIRGVKVKESPSWLQGRLRALGQRPINNIVDITNYVMLQTGQPLHAFDLSRLKNMDGAYAVRVRASKKGEKMIALDDISYEMSAGTILITDENSEEILGLAGIKGGKASGISPNTTDILLESANFNPISIRLASQALKLRTESSFRFEKDISPELALKGLSEAIKLIEELTGGKIEGVTDVYPEPQTVKTISLLFTDVQKILGIEVPKDKIKGILTSLGCEVAEIEQGFDVKVPPQRLDLVLKEDIIEEIGRIHGYENIPAVTLPPATKSPVINKLFYYTSRVGSILCSLGFSEIKTYSFTGKGTVEVLNPIASDKPFLRENLSLGVSESLKQNEYNSPLLGLEQIKVFEIGNVFGKDSEYTSLCLAVQNVKGFKAVKELEALSKALKTLESELHLKIDTKEQKGIVECNLEEAIKEAPEPKEYLFESAEGQKKYKPISVFPFILRDIAIFVPEDIEEKQVSDLVRKSAGNLLVRQSLFDIFKKDGKVSYAFRLVFQSHEKTLSDEEINKVMEKIVGEVNKKGWVVR